MAAVEAPCGTQTSPNPKESPGCQRRPEDRATAHDLALIQSLCPERSGCLVWLTALRNKLSSCHQEIWAQGWKLQQLFNPPAGKTVSGSPGFSISKPHLSQLDRKRGSRTNLWLCVVCVCVCAAVHKNICIRECE